MVLIWNARLTYEGGRKLMERLFRKELMAVLPEYIRSKGNCTVVYLEKMEPFVIERSIKTVIKALERHYKVTPREVKTKYQHLISSSNLIPMPLSEENIFVPIKTRTPICKNDGAFSYINIKHIYIVTDKKDYREVCLSDGKIIKSISTLPTLQNHIRNGYIIKSFHKDYSINVAENEGDYVG
jgi:hypothetical protein